MSLDFRAVFDFGRPASVRFAFIALLVATVLSPDLPTPAGLPLIRAEQLMLAAWLPSLAFHYYRHRELWRVSLVDYAFIALGFAICVTLVAAPIFLDPVEFSIRDPFELARLAELWFLYRLGILVQAVPALRQAIRWLLALAVGVAAFALVQYLDPGSFNQDITGIWAVRHNLDAVERAGRTVGTIGNANYFGAFSSALLIGALSLLILRQESGRYRWLAVVAACAATFSVVTAQSRTAILALLFAMMVLLVLVVLKRRANAAYALVVGLFLFSTVASITFVEVRKPDVGSFSSRFAPRGINDDSSLTIRLSRWRTIFAGFLSSGPSFCEGERFENRRISDGHEPADSTGWPESDAAALARDETRKDDVAALTRAVLDYYCDEDEWPIDVPLAEALVPDHLDALPADPVTGEPYLAYVDRGGFFVGAELENRADPEGPVYTLGTIPNIASNPSFESGNPPDRWRLTGEATAGTIGEALFGDDAARVEAPPPGSFLDTIVFDFGRDKDYVAGAFVRAAGDQPVELQMVLTATLADGSVLDLLAGSTFTIEPGGWTQLSVPFRTPEEGRLTIVQVILGAPPDGQPVAFFVDGATMTQGTFAPGFVRITDTDPSRLRIDDLPRFVDSPIFGAGPRKDIELGTVDNEYALFLDRYGLLGTAAYLALFGGAFFVAYRSWREAEGIVGAVGLTMTGFCLVLLIFNIAAGSYYHFQIMAVFWLLTGALAAARTPPPPLERHLG